MDIKPLVIYGHVSSEVLGLIKATKWNLGLDFQVQIFKALPGCGVRVLALGEEPNFICDYAYVKDIQNTQSMEAAMRWVLTDTEDSRAVTILDMLKRIFGGGVRELESENVPEKVVSQ